MIKSPNLKITIQIDKFKVTAAALAAAAATTLPITENHFQTT